MRTREAILDGLNKAASDNKVASIVLIGKGISFPAGADITEFSKGLFFNCKFKPNSHANRETQQIKS